MDSKFYMILAIVVVFSISGIAQEEIAVDGFQQLLPRGEIPAIINPEYVPAQEAEIANDTWVLGVVINGHARAFSLNLLNHHEIVNDQIDSVSYAAVW